MKKVQCEYLDLQLVIAEEKHQSTVIELLDSDPDNNMSFGRCSGTDDADTGEEVL
jgi:hypothetical protein